MKMLVLAGGFGTRLQSEVAEVPKALAPVFNEKISGQGLGWINAGLCQLKASFFSNWDGQPFSLERITFPALADQGILKAVPIQTYFIDIGIPQDYLSFCGWIKSGNENEI